jgi:predicted membrane protein DUF2231
MFQVTAIHEDPHQTTEACLLLRLRPRHIYSPNPSMPTPEYIRGAPGLYRRGTTNQDAERQQDTSMALIGKLHPLLVHFPIALVMAATAAQLVAIATPRHAWHTVAVANHRVAATIAS